ncbi:MAG: prolyl oligopeptidase family serine peptidase [Anaerolineales bacterium]|nr:prolyl oligopeptidase family serine peptidase [Anaerolineales bacterium]MDW8276689.1 prolyl oligopeptidase family serine peptidase [Anaerolineales bacterium]
MAPRIESLLSARLFLSPQLVGDRVFFISNLSGRLSLYAMNYGGSVPEPLLPPHIALQNPDLIGGRAFHVFPHLGKILVMLDRDGDENYQPMLVPIEGGFPEPAFDNFLAAYRVHLTVCDSEQNIAYLTAERRDQPLNETYRADLAANRLEKIDQSQWGGYVSAASPDHRRLLIGEGYTVGDSVLYLREDGRKMVLYGKPLEQRASGETVPLNGLGAAAFSPTGNGALVICSVFQDTYSLGYIPLNQPGVLQPVRLKGIVHQGAGEMTDLEYLHDDRYAITFNIDGCSWLYEGVFDEDRRVMKLKTVVLGSEPLDSGDLQHVHYDKTSDIFTLSFSTAVSPTQIYSIEGKKRDFIVVHTSEKVLGIPEEHLSKGEDASFVSFDGLRISARLYLPAEALGYQGPRPLVYYIHGGPQSQERPNFAWFSMPLIQYLTLRGFAVFVPNVRGSTGYGLAYTKHVDRDWGGKDRLDHVHAMTHILPQDPRLDVRRAAVVGRSYGGYMTLMLAGMHPELWQAACDMFGPYDLLTFLERIPSTWKPYFKIALGDPELPQERALLIERSPKTHLHQMTCPMLVIQGRNDPRVVAAESEDLVNALRAQGKDIQLLLFEDEGHDVLKYENRITCYNAITDFFAKYLRP